MQREGHTQTKTQKKHTGGENNQRAPRPGRARRRRADLRALHGQGAARDEGRDERGHLRRERRLRPETGKSQGARRDAAADDDCYWWTLFRAGGAEIGVGKRVDGVGVELACRAIARERDTRVRSRRDAIPSMASRQNSVTPSTRPLDGVDMGRKN